MLIGCYAGLIDEDKRDFWSHYRIVKSNGNGHCILNSLATSLDHKYVKKFSVSWLLEKMKHECTINYNRYIPCMDGDINGFHNKMNRYVMYKEYDSYFCDLLSYIMANALTHWGLVTPYGDSDLGQHWLR